jgi:hypothetical protein
MTTATTAMISVLTYFAAMNRERDGSRENVTIAVRWVHSLVTDITPSTGSRMFIGMFAPAAKSLKLTVRSWASTTHSWMTSTRAVSAATEMSSQRPESVSSILRSSTRTRRANGTFVVPEMSIIPGAGTAAVALTARLLP